MNLLNNDNSRFLRLGYIAFALVVALLYDVFFWKQENGIAFPLFVILYIAGFLLLTILTKQFRQRWTLLFLVPILVLSFDVILYNNDLVHYTVTKAVFLLTIIFSLLATLHNPHKHRFSFRHIPLIGSLDLPFMKWGEMYRDLFRWDSNKDKDVVRKVAIGLAISIPVLLIFTALFVQADAVFSQWLGNLFDSTEGAAWVWRIARTILFTVFIGSFLYVILSSEHVLGHKDSSVLRLDKVVIGVLLALVNALFLVFVFIQFKYLFGANNFVLENGLVYADYARKGFFELAWVVGLAALLLIGVYRSFVHHGISKVVTALQTLLIAQVAVIAVSALKRMNVYQDAYGYTVLRLYVEWFIYFVLVVLFFTGLSLLAKVTFRRFLYASLALGVLAFMLVASVNVDKVIAKENIDRFLERGKTLDLNYLDQLSTDVLPVFHQLLRQENLKKFSVADQLYIEQIFKRKQEALAKRDSWREWHAGDFSNRYWAVPPAEFYTTMENLKIADAKYQVADRTGIDQIVPENNCAIYWTPLGLDHNYDTACLATTLQGKNYVYVLDMRASSTLQEGDSDRAGAVDHMYATTFMVYEMNALKGPYGQSQYTKVFTKNFPSYSYKTGSGHQDNVNIADRYELFKDGRILERSPENLKHYTYVVAKAGNEFSLVQLNSLEK